MKTVATVAGALAMMSGVALAGGGVTVQLPDVSGLSEAEAKALIAELAQINVITSNCPDYAISDGEWTLITGTGDRLAGRLGLDAAGYERAYFAPAFKLLDDPAACDRVGPRARPLLEKLIGMGGRPEVAR